MFDLFCLGAVCQEFFFFLKGALFDLFCLGLVFVVLFQLKQFFLARK